MSIIQGMEASGVTLDLSTILQEQVEIDSRASKEYRAIHEIEW